MTRSPKEGHRPAKAPATAAGQALGYSLQFTRLTAMLLEADEGSTLSLEVLDDVAEEAKSGRAKLIQSKSALSANPVSDKAIPLWKTLYNWLELVKRGLVNTDHVVFEVYVSRPVAGDQIAAFSSCRNRKDLRTALATAREVLWGKPPAYGQKGRLPASLGRYANPVLEADEDLLAPVILNLRLECGSGSPQTDIESAIRRHPVPASLIPNIADKLCGWVKREVDKQLEKGLPAIISRDAFHQEYVAFVRMVDRDIILKSWSKQPSETEKQERLSDMFVQQLDLIELNYDDKLEAVSDFLRACADRAHWSKAGVIHDDSFVELDENLQRAWRNLKRIVEHERNSVVTRGQRLHAQCMTHQAKVQGMEPQSHFVPGCFHRLADSLTVGWHPQYDQLLRHKGRRKQ